MVLRKLSLAVGLVLALLPSVASAGDPVTTGNAPPPAGFVELSAGYQRMPAPDVHYVDADFEVSGGADPRWKPWNPAHLEAARARAQGPTPSVRDATQHAYLLSLRGDRVGAEAGLAAAKQRYPKAVGVYWSEGWIRLNLLDFEGALVAWQQAERLHGGQPFWVPYSKAIALMGLEDGDAALAWWQVAQSAYAPDLATANAARKRFQHWRTTEKMLLEKVIDRAYLDDHAEVSPAGSGLQMVDSPQPRFPPSLLRLGIQGETMVRVRVDTAGAATAVAVESSSGYAEMDAEALRVARLARFKVPAGIGPDGLWALVPYRFDLGPGQPAPPAAARKAEIDRIIAQRMAEMRAEATKGQAGQPAE